MQKPIEAPDINIRGYVIFYDLASRGVCLYFKEELNPVQVNFNLQQGVFSKFSGDPPQIKSQYSTEDVTSDNENQSTG